MIKKLRRKFIVISLITLFLIEILIIGTINGINLYNQNVKIDNMLSFLIENNGDFPDVRITENRKVQKDVPPRDFSKPSKNMNEETRYITRYFVVAADKSNSIIRVDTGHIAAIDSEKAIEYGSMVLENKSESGRCDNYKYLMSKNENETVIVFVDCRMEMESQKQLLEISFIIAISAFLLFSIIIILLSKKVVKPYIVAVEKQKQFITDAGHEIKTPLAIISANNEVIEMINGESEWTQSTNNQVKRLNELVAQLILLSKMDENFKSDFREFNLSKVINETILPFVSLAKSSNKQLGFSIDDDIMFVGDEDMIKRLVCLLLDNGLKYSNEFGQIKVGLASNGRNIKFYVFNTCDGPLDDDLDKLFDRFYRPDNSRSRETGGYGIGLSTAKSIVQLHKGRISAKAENGGIIFEVSFKCN